MNSNLLVGFEIHIVRLDLSFHDFAKTLFGDEKARSNS